MIISTFRKSIAIFLFVLINTFQLYAQVNIGASSYTTLKAAFDDINAGLHTGDIVITLSGNTSESTTARLNAPFNGASNYTSVTIYPTTANVSVIGNIAAGPVIDLYSATHVTIDGRINLSGNNKELSIINVANSSTVNTSTIRFIASAYSDTIRYCTIKGSTLSPTAGVVFFASGSVAYGNKENCIEYCDLTCNGINRPSALIYSNGSGGLDNSSNCIRNNNLYNIFQISGTSNGIFLENLNSNWLIKNNSFYETNSIHGFGAALTAIYNSININCPTNGNGHVIDQNYFGGSAPQCGGAAFTIDSTNVLFNFIQFATDTIGVNEIKNNIFKNIRFEECASSCEFHVINGSTGNYSVQNNLIGSDLTNDELFLESKYGSISNYAISIKGAHYAEINDNVIGSVTCSVISGSLPNSFTAIEFSGDSAFIHNNTIGSSTIPNSIQCTGMNGNTYIQNLFGIDILYSSSKYVIVDNLISNLYNNASNTNNGSVTIGIGVEGSSAGVISRNTVSNISTNCQVPLPSYPSSLIGISYNSESPLGNVIANNLISNLYSGAGVSTSITGLYFTAGLNNLKDTIASNYIHNFQDNQYGLLGTAEGIRIKYYSNDSLEVFNNVINLGQMTYGELVLRGIYTEGNGGALPGNSSFYHNTVSVTVYPHQSVLYESAAFYKWDQGMVKNIRNNILSLVSTDSIGFVDHFVMDLATTINLTIDNNDYFVTGPHAKIGKLGITSAATFVDWQNTDGQDFASLNLDPAFGNNGSNFATDLIAATTLHGAPNLGITTDYLNAIRSNPPQMGAFETTCIHTFFEFDYSACQGDSIIFGDSIYTTSGTYSVVHVNVAGCDSIVEMHLTVHPLPTPVIIQSGDQLSVGPYLVYEWNLNGNPIPNSFIQNYTALVNGWYTVLVVDSNNCRNVSDSVNVTTAKVKSIKQIQLGVSPNPALNTIKIIYPQDMIAALVDVMDVSGQVVINEKSINDQIDISGLAGGTYFVVVHNKEQSYKVQFVKQ